MSFSFPIHVIIFYDLSESLFLATTTILFLLQPKINVIKIHSIGSCLFLDADTTPINHRQLTDIPSTLYRPIHRCSK